MIINIVWLFSLISNSDIYKACVPQQVMLASATPYVPRDELNHLFACVPTDCHHGLYSELLLSQHKEALLTCGREYTEVRVIVCLYIRLYRDGDLHTPRVLSRGVYTYGINMQIITSMIRTVYVFSQRYDGYRKFWVVAHYAIFSYTLRLVMLFDWEVILNTLRSGISEKKHEVQWDLYFFQSRLMRYAVCVISVACHVSCGLWCTISTQNPCVKCEFYICGVTCNVTKSHRLITNHTLSFSPSVIQRQASENTRTKGGTYIYYSNQYYCILQIS